MTESAGTMSVGTLLGIVAVAGKDCEDEPICVDEGARVEGGALNEDDRDASVGATIRYVCEGV